MRSAAGDPDLEHLFHPQLTDEDPALSILTQAHSNSTGVPVRLSLKTMSPFGTLMY